MTTKDAFELAAAIGAIIGALWASVRYMIGPHLRESIGDTIEKKVGPQLTEVPKLTYAVDRLTGAIERQTTDTEHLTTSLNLLGEKVDKLGTAVEVHDARIDTLDRSIESLRKPAPRTRRGKK